MDLNKENMKKNERIDRFYVSFFSLHFGNYKLLFVVDRLCRSALLLHFL